MQVFFQYMGSDNSWLFNRIPFPSVTIGWQLETVLEINVLRGKKDMFKTQNPKCHGIYNRQRELISGNHEITKRCKDYLEELYEEDKENQLRE